MNKFDDIVPNMMFSLFCYFCSCKVQSYSMWHLHHNTQLANNIKSIIMAQKDAMLKKNDDAEPPTRSL